MAVSRSTSVRFGISPLTRTALASLAVGFLAALLSVEVARLIVGSATRNAMYFEEDIEAAIDDGILNRKHHRADGQPSVDENEGRSVA